MVTARALLVSDGALWADEATALRWALVDEDEDLETFEDFDAEGPTAELTLAAATPRLLLAATFPSGSERRALLDLPVGETVASMATFTMSLRVIAGLDVSQVEADALTLEVRRATTADPAEVVPQGGFARLGLVTDDPTPDGLRSRWMTVGSRGTFFELDATRTDWAAGVLVVDDDDIEARRPLSKGFTTAVGLALDDAGGTATAIRDLVVEEAPTALTTRGRALLVDAVPEEGLVRGRLTADDTSPTGLRLVEARAVRTGDLDADDPYGTRALPCAEPVDGPFDPSWLADQRCLRGALEGAVVVVETP